MGLARRSRNLSNGVGTQSAQRLGSRSQRKASASVTSFELRALCDEKSFSENKTFPCVHLVLRDFPGLQYPEFLQNVTKETKSHNYRPGPSFPSLPSVKSEWNGWVWLRLRCARKFAVEISACRKGRARGAPLQSERRGSATPPYIGVSQPAPNPKPKTHNPELVRATTRTRS
jgi:hypothetical protein